MNKISASSVAVFLNDGALERIGLERIAKAVDFRFDVAAPVYVAVPDNQAQAVRDLGMEPVDAEAAVRLEKVDTWVIALGFLPIFAGEGGFENVSLPGTEPERSEKSLFIIEPDGFVHPLTIKSDGSLDAPCLAEFDPHLETNVFARLGNRNFRGAAYFFPYNGFYIGHPSAFGPIDSFGFRNPVDTKSLESRQSGHIVIAVFGGSTVWSPCCLQSETFCAQLQDILTSSLQETGDKRSVTVLNLGISGHTVLNEMISYLLFCHKVKPNVVIAHDLFNDIANGIQTDPVLLGQHDMTYMAAMEKWGQQLMGADSVPLTQSATPGEPIRIMSSPQAIARAYLIRKRQFSDLVEQSGAVFVWGTQPAWFAKEASENEQQRFSKIRAQSPQLDPMYRALPHLYELVLSAVTRSDIAYPVNLHGEFSTLTTDDDVFVDHAHLNPKGEAIIAKVYAKLLMSKVFPTLHEGSES